MTLGLLLSSSQACKQLKRPCGSRTTTTLTSALTWSKRFESAIFAVSMPLRQRDDSFLYATEKLVAKHISCCKCKAGNNTCLCSVSAEACKLKPPCSQSVMTICALYRYENSDSMAVDCPPSVLAPGASQDVSVIFSPCEARLYREEIPFKINGLYTMKVVVMGEGSNLKLELGNAAHRSLNLGAVSCGGQTSKTVQVRPLTAASQHARLVTEGPSACLAL